MTNRNFSIFRKLVSGWGGGLAIGAGLVALLTAVISCSTVHRAVVQLPMIPGATYIGSKECEQCHDKIYRDFATADHARLMTPGPNALNAGCESCHGPASLHAESGGEVKPPYSFAAGRPLASSYEARLAVPPARSEETVCFQCHTDVRGQFNLPSHHPVPEGKMSCTDCHSPHKGSIHMGGGTSLLAENESCFRCHPAQRGPLRVRTRGHARRMHDLSHAARIGQRQIAHRAGRQPLFQMPFPAGQRRQTFSSVAPTTPCVSSRAPAGRRAAMRPFMVPASVHLCVSSHPLECR